MLKWFKCFFLGHRWIERGNTWQNQTYHGERIKTVNFIILRCDHCGKYKEYQTKAYYDKFE